MRSFARLAHPVVVGLFLACGMIQVFLAGLGVFNDPGTFLTHRDFGYLFGWLTLLALILAVVGRERGRITGLSALLLGLFALQSILIALRGAAPAIAALHPLNGFLLLAVAGVTLRLSWAARDRPAEVSAAPEHAASPPEAARRTAGTAEAPVAAATEAR